MEQAVLGGLSSTAAWSAWISNTGIYVQPSTAPWQYGYPSCCRSAEHSIGACCLSAAAVVAIWWETGEKGRFGHRCDAYEAHLRTFLS